MIRLGHGFALAFAAAVATAWAAAMGLALTAAPPPTSGGRVVALFPPGSTDETFAAIIRSGGRPIGRSWAGLVWAVGIDAGGAQRLEAAGAVAVLADVSFAAALGCAGVPPRGTRTYGPRT